MAGKYKLCLDEDRMPYLVKEGAVKTAGRFNSPDKFDELIHRAFNVSQKSNESVYMLALETNNAVKAIFEVSSGTKNACMFDPSEIFERALLCHASMIVMVHNHLSPGIPEPSSYDVKVTKRLKEAGDLLNVPFLDHVIVSPEVGNYYSFHEHGEL